MDVEVSGDTPENDVKVEMRYAVVAYRPIVTATAVTLARDAARESVFAVCGPNLNDLTVLGHIQKGRKLIACLSFGRLARGRASSSIFR